jgi:hypothetical protein
MPNSKQDMDFAEEMQQQVNEITMSNSTLDTAIDWISSNLSPDDVFSEKELQNWAESNGYTKE